MVGTRARKRPVSPDIDSQPEPAKKTRQTKTATKTDSSDKPTVRKAAARGKKIVDAGTADQDGTDQDDAIADENKTKSDKKLPARGKKAGAVARNDEDGEIDSKKPAKKPARGKKTATRDDAVNDDDTQGSTKPKAAAKKATAKTKKANARADQDDKEDETNHTTKDTSNGQKEDKAKMESLEDMKAESSSTQFAKAENLAIPVDECCPLSNYRVYVDSTNRIIYDASLNQTNAGHNNNKFYRIQLLKNGVGRFVTWTRWGRVGESGQNATMGEGTFEEALAHFEKKFKDKSGLKWEDRLQNPKPKKYTFIERSYEAESDDEEKKNTNIKEEDKEPEPESTLPKQVQNLMAFIFDQDNFNATMASMQYDAKKMPLGKLSRTTILRGYSTLKDLSALLDDHSLASSVYGISYSDAVANLSNQFFSYIPHDFGRNRPYVVNSDELLKREVQLLENLTDLKDADTIVKAEKGKKVNMYDAQYKGLGMQEMTPVDAESTEFENISEYLMKTRGSTHGHKYQIIDIFRIERTSENDRFKKMDQSKSERKLLWHGSRSTNYGGILSQGLRIAPPEAPVSGYMFGKGVYLADMSSKSANYCYHHISSGQALLLLCEAELGNPIQMLTAASYSAGEDAQAKGMLSTWGQGLTGPLQWKDAECIHPSLKGVKMPDTTKTPGPTHVDRANLQYNEYICYDVSQIRLRYLLRVKM